MLFHSGNPIPATTCADQCCVRIFTNFSQMKFLPEMRRYSPRHSPRFRIPKPRHPITNTQNSRPTSHEKPAAHARRIRDPRLTALLKPIPALRILISSHRNLEIHHGNHLAIIAERKSQDPRP